MTNGDRSVVTSLRLSGKVFFNHFQLFTLFCEKNHEQLINCSSTDSDNIWRYLQEKNNSGSGRGRGESIPLLQYKNSSRKRWPLNMTSLISYLFHKFPDPLKLILNTIKKIVRKMLLADNNFLFRFRFIMPFLLL